MYILNCKQCGHELHAANIMRLTDDGLEVQPGYECRHCWAMHDIVGNLLTTAAASFAPSDQWQKADENEHPDKEKEDKQS